MRKKYIPLAILLVIMMFVIVGLTNEKEMIFPEIAALAVGAWVMEQSPWGTTVFNLCLSPTVAAFMGVLILKMFPYSPYLMILGAFMLVIVQLKLLHSNVLPAVSAAILPIITHAHSWFYPLSVFIFTGLIAVGRMLIITASPQQKRSNKVGFSDPEPSLGKIQYWVKLFLGVMLITAFALRFKLLYMVAPPLFVTFIELSNPCSRLRKRLGGILIELIFSSLIGVMSLYFLHNILYWPIWVSSGLALGELFIVYIILKLPFPPAAAICLLPTLLPKENLGVYPFEIMLGTLSFMALDVLWFKKKLPTYKKEGYF